ncbi:MAG: hypothetical protein ACPGN3_09470 [Opitutales bacterium]
MDPTHARLERCRGATLLAVMMITSTIAIVLASLYSYSLTEKKLNVASEAQLIARQAAEATAEYGFAQLTDRFTAQSSFPPNHLKPTEAPLELPSEFLNIFSKGASGNGAEMSLSIGDGTSRDWGLQSVITPSNGFNPQANWGSQELELIGGEIATPGWTYIDPDIPGNEQDPLVNQRVFKRFVKVFSKATVESGLGKDVTAYTSQNLEIRDVPLFAYAIFYNGMPLEIAPGPAMDIHGPVHSNSDIYVRSHSGLVFHDKITTASDLFIGRHTEYHRNGKPVKESEDINVSILDGSGTPVPMEPTKDSSDSQWRTYANQRWDYQVQTQDHGISPQTPRGVLQREHSGRNGRIDWSSTNYSYNLIQPLVSPAEIDNLASQFPSLTEAQIEARRKIETEKYAHKAGLVLEYDGSEVSAYTYQRDSDGLVEFDNASNTPDIISFELDSDDQFWKVNTEGEFTDARENASPDLIEIDVGALKALLDANDASDWGGDEEVENAAEAIYNSARTPENFWNGVVYIKAPLDSSKTPRIDGVHPADPNVAVRLLNGSEIPNPDFAASSGNYGATFATNTHLYVQGHFNADGMTNSGGSRLPDDSTNFALPGEEAPASLVADAITILSPAWDDDESDEDMEDRKAEFTEISAALLTGQVPSNYYGQSNYSGGVENLPRFLEDWRDVTLRLRGSLVGLFNSEVATERWGKADVYVPPTRDWGFHDKFQAEGFFPPGTPNARTFTRSRFTDLNQADYVEEITELADLWDLTTAY